MMMGGPLEHYLFNLRNIKENSCSDELKTIRNGQRRSILAYFRAFGQFFGILVKKRTIWSVFFGIFEISEKFPTKSDNF